MRSFIVPNRTLRRSGGGGASCATGLPWRVITMLSPFSTARISSCRRFLASAMLTSIEKLIIATIYGQIKSAGRKDLGEFDQWRAASDDLPFFDEHGFNGCAER